MIGREAQIAELTRVTGLDTDVYESPVPLVIVYGAASTGKSLVISQMLRTHEAPYTLVDCTAVYSAKELYREALAQLYTGANTANDYVPIVDDNVKFEEEEEEIADEKKKKKTKESENDDTFRSLNFLSFYKALSHFMISDNVTKNKNNRQVIYLAFDHVDKLLDRRLGALITCVCTINDQIGYLNIFHDSPPPWKVCVLLITRGISMDFDRLVMAFLPAYVHFSPYKPEQIADILVEQLGMKETKSMFRTWLIHLYGLLPPAPDGDWLQFRAAVVHLLPDFYDLFVRYGQGGPQASKMKNKIERDTKTRVQAFLHTRRKHLFGYHKVVGSGLGDPSESISCTNLSRNCLLLVLAGYLASFNPQETDLRFLSSSGGQRRKKRAKKSSTAASLSTSTSDKKQQISQLLIGPRIFTLQRLLAIYLNLRVEAEAGSSVYNDDSHSSETREETFTHLATLVRMQLFQRTTAPHVLDNIKFRCLADARFVQETARYLSFPLEAYLNRST